MEWKNISKLDLYRDMPDKEFEADFLPNRVSQYSCLTLLETNTTITSNQNVGPEGFAQLPIRMESSQLLAW